MRKYILLALASITLLSCNCDQDIKSARALAGRIMGPQSKSIVFEKIESEEDIYEIEALKGKVYIRANNANSMAVGLNRYLQEFCLTNVSWYDYNPVELPQTLPLPEEKVSAQARVDKRFFLNYCTYGYTMPWWKWEQWEHFIDWMALNGVNMPLAITGQEAVWQKVWKKFGLSDEQIRSFFVGPAHLPWQRMCNLDYWQGPLPQSWIDEQAKLQKKIVKRERELNMTPVLPAFAGHVPAELAEVTEEKLDTFRVSYWGGFADEYRCTFLSPMDKHFAQIQKAFLEEQTRLYGTDHIYGVDPFNEVDAPFWDPETLAQISKGIYESLTAVDPEAIWLQMGWLFYADEGHWTDENIKAYLTAVPQGKMIILDYYCDYTQIWKRTESFYGQDFIWCYLGNFGGMTGIEGDFHQNDEWIEETMRDGGPGFIGLGSTLEGFGVNEPVYEAVFAKAWDTGISLEQYIDNIADRHLGRVDEDYRRFWHQIADKVSVTHSSTGSASMLNAHPNLEGRWHWTTVFARGYDPAELEKAWEILQQVEGESSYLAYDKANVHRQVLCNRTEAARDRFTAAYKAGDREAMLSAKSDFLQLCDEITAVLRTRREFSLSDWIEDARSWGKTPQEKDYYEMNARTLVSVWGDSFHLWDYANRDWDDLVDTYYKVRWEKFFDAVIAAYDAGEPFVNAVSTGYVGVNAHGSAEGVEGRALQFDNEIWDFACQWAKIK
ncbi:MAG: alpha-N-acetylglucosaminidase [Candidatus Cryptobacteroides sp.]